MLQGWTLEEYERHDAMYRKAGINLAAQRRVGLGSICRRDSVQPGGAIAERFARRGYRLHGFGLKTTALRAFAPFFRSADSMAWSEKARKTSLRLPGCPHKGICNNCPRWALTWHGEVSAAIGDSEHYRSAQV